MFGAVLLKACFVVAVLFATRVELLLQAALFLGRFKQAVHVALPQVAPVLARLSQGGGVWFGMVWFVRGRVWYVGAWKGVIWWCVVGCGMLVRVRV